MSWWEGGRKARGYLGEALELPGDISLSLPKIIITGNIKLYVENHRGIIEYRSNLIRLSLGELELSIEGDGLTLGSISDDEITVDGTLKKISFN